jgi:hypothetical protein
MVNEDARLTGGLFVLTSNTPHHIIRARLEGLPNGEAPYGAH